MKKLRMVCNNSGLECEEFGYYGRHKHLPDMLKYAPQHIVYDEKRVALIRFKPSYDTRFIEMTKAEIVRTGAALGVPFDKTWSCYQGGRVHCGKCGTCIERREAFNKAGIPDPTVYGD